jgi:hypothetical protein
MISNGYPTGTHQISREKNDTRHFIKWNAHACEHFVFLRVRLIVLDITFIPPLTMDEINEALNH